MWNLYTIFTYKTYVTKRSNTIPTKGMFNTWVLSYCDPTPRPKANGPHPMSVFQPGVDLQCLLGVSLHTNDTGNTLLGKLGMSFRRWCRAKKVEAPHTTWNLHFIGRTGDKKGYPELDSNVKASHCKPILFFLAELANGIGTLCPCTWVLFFLASFEFKVQCEFHA